MSTTDESLFGIYQNFLRQGKLAYQYSVNARRPVFYPRKLCPYTGDSTLEWRIACGRGTVYSCSAVHTKEGESYNVSLIDCEEGFRLMSTVVGVPAEQVAIGMSVQFEGARDFGDDLYPVFAPVADS